MSNEQSKMNYDEELSQMNEDKKKNYDEVYPPSWGVPEGTTAGEFISDERRTVPDKQGGKIKKILSVKVDEKILSWWINPANPIYPEILKEGAKRKTLVGVKFTLTRIGMKEDSRYKIKFV